MVLPGIATINNAKLEMVADSDADWFVSYNFENIDKDTGKPVGTLRIPCFLKHDGRAVDSRHILKSSIKYFEKTLFEMLKNHPEAIEDYGIKAEDIEKVVATAATELEFWVKTPNDEAELEALSTSQMLQEQYWKRTKAVLEQHWNSAWTLWKGMV